MPAQKSVVSELGKTCTKCGNYRIFDGFDKEANGIGGRCSRCRDCRDESRTWERLLRVYGLSKDQFEEMFLKQGHRCKLCGASDITPCVDHDYETGAVRGILCIGCNVALGAYEAMKALGSKLDKYLSGSDV